MTGARTVLLFLQSKDSDALFMCRVLHALPFRVTRNAPEEPGCRCPATELRTVSVPPLSAQTRRILMGKCALLDSG